MPEQMMLAVDGPSSASGSVPKRTRACLRCGGEFEVNPHHPDEHKFCHPDCKAAYHREQNEEQDGEDDGLPKRAGCVLARLGQGRATGMDLLRAGGGTRYGARIEWLRKHGHRVLGPRRWRRADGTMEEETLPKTEDGHDVYGLGGEL